MTNIEILKTFQANGINLVHRYNSLQTVPQALADLQAARSAGIGVLQNLPRALLIDRDMPWWRSHIQSLAQDRQFLIWYLPEERTEPAEIQRNKELAGLIEQLDPLNRPRITYVERAEPVYLRDSSTYVDALVFGAYPSYYSPRPRIDIRRRIDFIYSSGVPVVFAAVEAVKLAPAGQRWPTSQTRPEHIRADAYLALISGAKGLMWYCWAQARDVPGLMDAVYDMARELNGPAKLGEVLLLGDVPEGITASLTAGDTYAPPASAYENKSTTKAFRYSSLQWTARRYEGYLYVFAVNVNERIRAHDFGGQSHAIRVQFRFPQDIAGSAEVIAENRNLDMSDGTLTDVFLPLQVHVYKIPLQEAPKDDTCDEEILL